MVYSKEQRDMSTALRFDSSGTGTCLSLRWPGHGPINPRREQRVLLFEWPAPHRARYAVYHPRGSPPGRGVQENVITLNLGGRFQHLIWTRSAFNLNTVGGWFLVLLFVWFIS